jgi:hypothetical protein
VASRRRWWILAVAGIAQLMVVLDQYVTTVNETTSQVRTPRTCEHPPMAETGTGVFSAHRACGGKPHGASYPRRGSLSVSTLATRSLWPGCSNR